MWRVRWIDPADDPETPTGWKLPSLVLATFFFNFYFWYRPASALVFIGPPALYFASLGTVTALVSALFFLGPALAAHRAGRPLFQLAEASLGAIPAAAFRVVCAILCVLWLAETTGNLVCNVLRFLLQRSLSVIESSVVLGALFIYLSVSGLQSLRTSAELALFSNKLGAAVLIAAAIRVRSGVPGAWSDLWTASGGSDTWAQIVYPLMILGPLAFLGADFGAGARRRREVAFIALFGLAVPMALTLFGVTLVHRAAYHGYSLGGYANILSALWGGDSWHFMPQWMLLATLTLFGLARFCVRMLRAAVAPVTRRPVFALTLSAVALAAIVALSIGGSWIMPLGMEITARVTSGVAALFTSDLILRRRYHARTRWVEWLPLLSVGVGIAAPGAALFWDPGAALDAHTLIVSILVPYAATFACRLLMLPVQLRTASRAADRSGGGGAAG